MCIRDRLMKVKQIVTGDETWIYHFVPERKRHSMKWKHPRSPMNTQIQESTLYTKGNAHCIQLFTRANTATVFREEFNNKCPSYSETLSNELKPAIRSKR